MTCVRIQINKVDYANDIACQSRNACLTRREVPRPTDCSVNADPLFFQLVARTRALVKGDRHVRTHPCATALASVARATSKASQGLVAKQPKRRRGCCGENTSTQARRD